MTGPIPEITIKQLVSDTPKYVGIYVGYHVEQVKMTGTCLGGQDDPPTGLICPPSCCSQTHPPAHSLHRELHPAARLLTGGGTLSSLGKQCRRCGKSSRRLRKSPEGTARGSAKIQGHADGQFSTEGSTRLRGQPRLCSTHLLLALVKVS